jgi:hypothetical protein
VSYKGQELLTVNEHLSSSPVFWSGPCCSPFFCPIMCFYILSSVLWCSLWFLHYNYIRFFFTSSCLQVLFTLCAFICAEWRPTHIVLCFVLFFFILCTLCCQFLWIVNVWMPLLYTLTFIYALNLKFITHLYEYSIVRYIQSNWTQVLQEEFEDTKGAIIIRMSKKIRLHNG